MKTLTIFLIILFFSIFMNAKILNVPAEYSSIQAAIDSSADGDTVLVAPGTYYENINFNGKNILVTSQFMLNNDFSFISNTIINGSTPSHTDTASCVLIISGEDSTAILQGFTITGGEGTAWPDEHSPGTYREGGGVMIALSSPVIQYNLIINNNATNKTGLAGAGGGGIRCGDGSPKILNNVIRNNKGGYGAGIVLNWTGAIIRNNIIFKNDGGQDYGGGGIWINKTNGKQNIIENNTIMNNHSFTDGGGLLLYNSTTTTTLKNNIIFGNTANTSPQISLRSGASVSAAYCDIEGGFTGTGNINANPLIDTTNFMLAIQLSPCIDTGDPDPLFNDPEDSNNPGLAESPSLGTIRNDIGAYGGPQRNFLPGIPTSIESPLEGYLEKDFKIYQNYPNPFNPSTKIKYTIPQANSPLLGGARGGSTFVQLEVYDILGNEVAVLVNEEQSPGNYEVEFSVAQSRNFGIELASGIYFYQLKAGGFSETKKMILLR